MAIFAYPLVWPSLSEELAPFLKYCKGIVLNAGSGQRGIQLGQRDLGIDIDANNNPDIVADLHRIPLHDESVDTIVSIAVLEHTRYAWIVAQEFYRVLRPGGYGVIAVPFLQPQHACPHDFVRFTSNGLADLMEYVGFEIVETKSVHHFGQTLAWLLWEYLQVNQPWRITWPFWFWLINQLSKGNLFGKDSPNTHNVEYVVVNKPGDSFVKQPYYLEALSNEQSTDWFLPLLSCPQSRQSLHRQGDRLISKDGLFTYDFKNGKPYIFPCDGEFKIKAQNHQTMSFLSAESDVNQQDKAVKYYPLTEQDLTVQFSPKVSKLFPHTDPAKIAVLATSEYEGIFQNGGVGTYYKNLAGKLNAEGWYVILLLCTFETSHEHQLNFTELKQVFSVGDIERTLSLQPHHLLSLADARTNGTDYLSMGCLFFVQGILEQFKHSQVYVEFHEMVGIGYRTLQAKQTNLLRSNCLVATTLHSGHEWVYEANEKYYCDYPMELWQVCHYEQYSFENADLAFFPSDYLRSKVKTYGWQTSQGIHLPNYIPLVTSKKI